MIRTRFAAVSFAIGAGFVLFGAASARAFTVDWSSPGYTYNNLGWQDWVSNPGQYDILQGIGNSGTNLDLGAGPVTVALEDITFTVGVNASYAWTNDFNVSRAVTIGNDTEIVSQTAHDYVSNSDSLQIDLANPVYFNTGSGEVKLTALEFDLPNVGVGTPGTGQLMGTLEAVPEPFTLALCAGGLGLAIARRRKAKKA